MFADISVYIIAATTNDIAELPTQLQGFEGITLEEWMLILLVSICAILGIVGTRMYNHGPEWLSSAMRTLRTKFMGSGAKEVTGIEELDKVIEIAGYAYDSKQDIFYSNLDAWQRRVGYCRLYDEAAAPMGMIIDCEPIYFEYDNKRWMIELWKGQYDLTTGCEIGVYSTEDPDIDIAGLFKGPFYNCVGNEDLLEMSYSLEKNGETLFTRKDKHWWLTGFKLGEFSEPWELTMNLNITLKDEIMRDAFVNGLIKAGYSKKDFVIHGNTISLQFSETRTPQPVTRTPETDRAIQMKNEFLCEKYNELTKDLDSLPDKIKLVQEQAPELYEEILKIGKTKKLFGKYENIRKHLS